MGTYSDEENSTKCKDCDEGDSSLVGSNNRTDCVYKVSALILVSGLVEKEIVGVPVVIGGC
jgi:hypothetical protein